MRSVSFKNLKVKEPIDLSEIPTNWELDNKDAKKHLKETRKALAKIQEKLYAYGKYSVLVCIQGMDTAGKDSLIRELFNRFNASGIKVYSFKVPSEREQKHDYLWRHYIALPEAGMFSIFNRTYYENVLVSRVHPQIVLNENLPNIHTEKDITPAFWEMRYEQIRNFEKHITQNGTIVFKFYLHLSKEEQKRRLLRRLEKPKHHWKFSPNDVKERQYWEAYQKYYQEAINKTSTNHAPWYVIPADSKPVARALIASILLKRLRKFGAIQKPELNLEDQRKLEKYHAKLMQE